MTKVFKISGRDGKKMANWYGKVKIADGQWQKVKLFTDKTASERRLMELQREADQRAAGVRTVAMDYASLPIQQHSANYIAALRLQKLDDDSLRIGKWMLDQLIEWSKWQRASDITADSVRSILITLEKQGKTASYMNGFIKRAKAFVHWMQREGRIVADPLLNLKRINERTGKHTRARRPLADHEAIALLENAPEDRREKYAWALLAGLRRSELAELRWGDLRLNAPRPFIQLRPEQTKNGKADVLPIHPYLLDLLAKRMPGMPDTRVVATVPDMKTMAKDLKRAGVALVDAKGRRSDFHALRHTFCTNLDRTGCSYTTKRALMRHADSGVTEGYSHARLDELYAAIERLPSPFTPANEQQAAKTGTADVPVDAVSPDRTADHQLDHDGITGQAADHRLDQSVVVLGQGKVSSDIEPKIDSAACDDVRSRYNLTSDIDLHSLAESDANNFHKSLNHNILRPSTQAV